MLASGARILLGGISGGGGNPSARPGARSRSGRTRVRVSPRVESEGRRSERSHHPTEIEMTQGQFSSPRGQSTTNSAFGLNNEGEEDPYHGRTQGLQDPSSESSTPRRRASRSPRQPSQRQQQRRRTQRSALSQSDPGGSDIEGGVGLSEPTDAVSSTAGDYSLLYPGNSGSSSVEGEMPESILSSSPENGSRSSLSERRASRRASSNNGGGGSRVAAGRGASSSRSPRASSAGTSPRRSRRQSRAATGGTEW